MNIKTITYDITHEYCTGTKSQPDTIIYFIKNKDAGKFLTYTALPPQHFYGKLPIVSIFSGLARVISATKAIFKAIMSSNKYECKNAFNNFFRGFFEILPFTGLPLIIFDLFKSRHYIQKIKSELRDQDNIVGAAIEGKVYSTVDLDKFNVCLKKLAMETHTHAGQLATFVDLANRSLKNSAVNSGTSMNKLLTESAKKLSSE